MTAGLGAEQRARVENWNKLMPLRDDVLKSLDTARCRKKRSAHRFEALVRLSADDSLYPLLEEYLRELPGLFIVSDVVLSHQTESGISAVIERAPGTMCERCWKYTHDVGSDAEIPDCLRVKELRHRRPGETQCVAWGRALALQSTWVGLRHRMTATNPTRLTAAPSS